MKFIEGGVSIAAPIDETFAWVANPRNTVAWLPSLVDVHDIEGEGAGCTYEWTYRMIGVPLHGRSEVTESDPPTSHVVETHAGVRSSWKYHFSPEGEGTRLNIIMNYTIPVPVLGTLAEALVHGQNQREFELALKNIKSHVEHAHAG